MAKRFPGGGAKRYVPCSIARLEARPQVEGETRAEGADEPETFQIAVSSEAEVERFGWFESWREVLDHSAGAVRLERFRSGSAAVLVDHETADQVGVIDKAWIGEDRVLRADIRFSRSARAQEVRQDVVDGIRRNVSVGYLPRKVRLMEENDELGDLWRVTDWEPVEASLVPIPADPSVGVGRNNAAGGFPPVEVEEEERAMEPDKGKAGATPAAEPEGRAVVTRDRQAEAREIATLAREHGVAVEPEWFERDLSPDAVARAILGAKRTTGKAQPSAEAVVALSERDAAGYSYASAILMAAGLRKREGREAEVHAEIARHLPENYTPRGGVFVPVRLSQRTMTSVDPTKGAETVFDRPGELIEMFRAQAMVARMGATILTGLTGPVVFPKQSGTVDVHWIGENPPAPVSASDLAFGLVTLSPRTLMGRTSYSRQLLMQAPSGGIDIENMVRRDLGIGHSLAIDRAALHGTGGAGEPTGLYSAPDVQTQDLSTLSFAKLVEMVGLIADANAPTDSLGWLTTPLVAAKLMATLRDSVAGADYIWTGTITDGRVAGYRAGATNQVSKTLGDGDEHGLVLGIWPECVIGSWGALELVVDPFTAADYALIKVTSFQMADVVFRHGEAFVKGEGVTVGD